MPALVIKKLPERIYSGLKKEAAQHHRSMTQQAIYLLEQGLRRGRPIPAVRAYKGVFSLTNEFIHAAKTEGRE